MSNAPIESKVYAATIGSSVGTVLAGGILWTLGVLFWNASRTASSAKDAIAAVPDPISAPILMCFIWGTTFLLGWWAKHSPRVADLPIPDAVPVSDQSTSTVPYGSDLPVYPNDQPTSLEDTDVEDEDNDPRPPDEDVENEDRALSIV